MLARPKISRNIKVLNEISRLQLLETSRFPVGGTPDLPPIPLSPVKPSLPTTPTPAPSVPVPPPPSPAPAKPTLFSRIKSKLKSSFPTFYKAFDWNRKRSLLGGADMHPKIRDIRDRNKGLLKKIGLLVGKNILVGAARGLGPGYGEVARIAGEAMGEKARERDRPKRSKPPTVPAPTTTTTTTTPSTVSSIHPSIIHAPTVRYIPGQGAKQVRTESINNQIKIMRK